MSKWLGKEIIYFEEIDSTQKEVWRRIKENNIQNGTLVIADLQTNGIGTHDRKWYKTQKGNISFSLCWFPNIDISKLENFTYTIADVLVNIFKDVYNIDLEIKIPNDLLIKGKKVGGILTETKVYGNIVKEVVIGIGINTNCNETAKEIENISASIKEEFNTPIDNMKVIKEFCDVMEKRIGDIV